MFKIGEKYKIYKHVTRELKEKTWVKAVVEHMSRIRPERQS